MRNIVVEQRPPGVVADVYFSFAAEEGFLGAVVMPGPFDDAFLRLNLKGLNPGGEVLVFEIPPGQYPLEVLLSWEQLGATGAVMRKDLSQDELAVVDSAGVRICEECKRAASELRAGSHGPPGISPGWRSGVTPSSRR